MALPLRVPVRISDSYADGTDLQLFPQLKEFPRNYLQRQDIADAFPGGAITHSRFKYRDIWWKLCHAQTKAGSVVFLAIVDELPAEPSSDNALAVRANGNMGRSVSFSAKSGHSELGRRNKFIDNLLVASDNPIPMDRYKALICLMSFLQRQMDSLSVYDPQSPDSWISFEQQELLQQVVKVGDVLARFGNADFRETSNSSRAITSKDYANLLKQYLETHGGIYEQRFLNTLSVALQDEALAVRSLLQTRCDANDLIFNQLIKHVGKEGQGGGATVINTSVINANPSNTCTANPSNTVSTTSTSTSEAKLKQAGLPALALVAAAALFLVKNKLFPGSSSSRGGSNGRSGGKSRGSKTTNTERVAVKFLANCQQELKKAQQNTELLENDWRLGKLRLLTPGVVHPPGFEPVETTYCNIDQFLSRLDSGNSS